MPRKDHWTSQWCSRNGRCGDLTVGGCLVVDSCELFGWGPLRHTPDDVQMVILPELRLGMTTESNVDVVANSRTLLTLIYIQEVQPPTILPRRWQATSRKGMCAVCGLSFPIGLSDKKKIGSFQLVLLFMPAPKARGQDRGEE